MTYGTDKFVPLIAAEAKGGFLTKNQLPNIDFHEVHSWQQIL